MEGAMRKSLSVVAVATLFLAAPAYAAELKIGVINGQQLIAESPQAAAVREKLEQEFAPKRRELLAQQNELKSLQEKFQKDAQVMSESERGNMERRIRDLGRDMQFGQQKAAEDFRARQNEELVKLQQALQQAINEFAKAEGYDLILSEGVAYNVDALNVTDEILARIKK
jgi:outer membrane protein